MCSQQTGLAGGCQHGGQRRQRRQLVKAEYVGQAMGAGRWGKQGKQGGKAKMQAGQAGQAGQAQMFVGLRLVTPFSIGVSIDVILKHDLGTFGMWSPGVRASCLGGRFGWNVRCL